MSDQRHYFPPHNSVSVQTQVADSRVALRLSLASALLQDAVPEDQQKEELMESITKGNFSLRILYEQLVNIQKMGPVGQVMSMIPGLSNSNLFSQVGTSHTLCRNQSH